MGRALVTKCIVSYFQGNAVFAVYFTVKSRLTSCTLLTRWSASVLKVGMPCEAYKRRLAYSTSVTAVTVRILA